MSRIVSAKELNLIELVISEQPEGKSIALIYKPIRSVTIKAEPVTAGASLDGTLEIYVPVSKEGSLLRDFVGQPIMQRKPIGYQRSFLDEYTPGTTFYLPKSLRSQLQGRVYKNSA